MKNVTLHVNDTTIVCNMDVQTFNKYFINSAKLSDDMESFSIDSTDYYWAIKSMYENE